MDVYTREIFITLYSQFIVLLNNNYFFVVYILSLTNSTKTYVWCFIRQTGVCHYQNMEYLSNAFVCKQWQRFHSIKLHQYYVMDNSLPNIHVNESDNV